MIERSIERRHFLRLPLAASALAVIEPAMAAASPDEIRSAVVVKAGADRTDQPFTWLDATFEVKVSGKDTEGRCVVFDTLRPKKVGPPAHLHTDCDEWFFVREGEFKFRVGDENLRLTAGDSLLVPRNVPHAFVKTSEGIARLIVMHQPAATMEEYFHGVIQLPDQSEASRKAFAERHGMRFVGPPLSPD